MAYYKPQSPIKNGENYIYPLTTADQIIMEDGTRWGGKTFVKSGAGAKAGLVPAPSTTAGTTKYLREDGTWAQPLTSHTHDYVPYTILGNADLNKNTNSGFYRLNSGLTNAPPSADWGQLLVIHGGGDTITQIHGNYSNGNLFTRSGNSSDVGGSGAWTSWKQVWIQGNSVTGAVWNDYAEYRESTTTRPGLVVFENGDDTLSPTTERLSHFAGIVSDTWGFCQGETERAKTPIAVAGRVLAYTYQDRNNYKPGDCVCAAPDGTVDIMTREEIIQYPDRIVGTVSCVPDYEEWGQGDRPAVKVDGRIWIKVK